MQVVQGRGCRGCGGVLVYRRCRAGGAGGAGSVGLQGVQGVGCGVCSRYRVGDGCGECGCAGGAGQGVRPCTKQAGGASMEQR